MAQANPLRRRWIRYDLPVMTKEEVDSWITYNKSITGRTYDQMIENLEKTKGTYSESQVTILQNLDLIITRLRILSRNEKIGQVIDNHAKTIAVRDVFEDNTGQTGDPKLSSVKGILDFAGVKTGRSRRTLKKHKQKKRTAKRKHYRV